MSDSYIDISCACVTSIDPETFGFGRSLTVRLELSRGQLEALLSEVIQRDDINGDTIKSVLADVRPSLVKEIEEEAVANAGEAYWEQRDRMAQ